MQHKPPSPPTLIDVLVGQGVPRESIAQDAEEFYRSKEGKLGEYLVARGKITPSQLYLALAEQAQERGGPDGKRLAMHYVAQATEVTHVRSVALALSLQQLIARQHG